MPDDIPGRSVVDLAAERASRSDDALDWTPLMALRKLVREIEGGNLSPDMLYVCMRVPEGEDTVSYAATCAGGDCLQFVGLLTTHVHQLLNDT